MVKHKRISSLDALRGLLIVLMALDHANFFIARQHSSGEYWGGKLPHYASALPFLTRAVTHLAAPGFFLLIGVGMALLATKRALQGWTKMQILRHFWLRGIILIALQFLVINRAWELSPDWVVGTYIGVLFALGGAMILGSLLVWLPTLPLVALAIVLFVGMELLVPDARQWGQIALQNPIDYLNPLLIYPGGQNSAAFWSNYPILPWLELVVFGLLLGRGLLNNRPQTIKALPWLGGGCLAAFALIRLGDGFSNLQPRAGNDWIDIFNLVKYPPSIAFTLLTTGINLLLLYLFEQAHGSAQKLLGILQVFGRVPLFFYVTHLFLYALAGLAWFPHGSALPTMYAAWLLGLLVLYPLCHRYSRFKHAQPANSPLRLL